MEWWYPSVPEWDGLLPPVFCGERPIIDSVRTPVAYPTTLRMRSSRCVNFIFQSEAGILVLVYKSGGKDPLNSAKDGQFLRSDFKYINIR